MLWAQLCYRTIASRGYKIIHVITSSVCALSWWINLTGTVFHISEIKYIYSNSWLNPERKHLFGMTEKCVLFTVFAIWQTFKKRCIELVLTETPILNTTQLISCSAYNSSRAFVLILTVDLHLGSASKWKLSGHWAREFVSMLSIAGSRQMSGKRSFMKCLLLSDLLRMYFSTKRKAVFTSLRDLILVK